MRLRTELPVGVGVLALRSPLHSFRCGPTRHSVGTRGPASWRALCSRVFSGQTAVPPPTARSGRAGVQAGLSRFHPSPQESPLIPPSRLGGGRTVCFFLMLVPLRAVGAVCLVQGSPFSQCSVFHSCCSPLWPCLRSWLLAFQLCVVGASLGAQMEEPMAFSALQGCDRSPSDDSLKKYEQNVKLSGMCLMPQFRQCTPSLPFCIS